MLLILSSVIANDLRKELRKIIKAECGLYSPKYINYKIIESIIWQESKFNPKAKSSKGCRGLMQISPCARRWHNKITGENVKPNDLYNAYTNIHIGIYHYAKDLKHNRFNITNALTDYNHGRNSTNKDGRYAKKVLRYYNRNGKK